MAKDNGIFGVAQGCVSGRQDGNRAGGNRAGCKGRAVDLCAWKCSEQIARVDQTRVQLNVGNGAIIGAAFDR